MTHMPPAYWKYDRGETEKRRGGRKAEGFSFRAMKKTRGVGGGQCGTKKKERRNADKLFGGGIRSPRK